MRIAEARKMLEARVRGENKKKRDVQRKKAKIRERKSRKEEEKK